MGVGLEGIRVVDFGHYISGPLASLLLSDAGADVVHVDRPGDGAADRPLDAFINRGKRRLTLDLKSPGDVAIAVALIGRADVVVENFRPGVMAGLGLGPDEMLAANPRLIYSSFPGFGSGDPDGGDPGWEGLVQAAAAGYRPLREHFDTTGRAKAVVTDREAPLFTPLPTASNFSGLLGATSIVMALIARERTGRGQLVEVPMVEAVAEAYSTMLSYRAYETPQPAHLMLPLISFRAADDRVVDTSPHAKFVIPLLEAAGVAEDWERLGLIDIGARSFVIERRDEIGRMFDELIGSHPGPWWDQVATEARLPCAMVRTPMEWMRSRHALESGAVVAAEDPIFGQMLLPGHGFDLESGPHEMGPRHLLDQDREDVIAELRAAAPANTAAGVAEPIQRPLDGYKVIDITQAVAGPTAARLLADFGAEVTKIGSPTPAVTDGIVGGLHRGKRTILMDLTAPQTADIKARLLAETDVLVTNFSPSSATRYGIDYENLRALNPGLVYCAISAYGQAGPWKGRRAYENQNNAATGMSWRYGSQFGWPLYQPSPVTDAATGVLGTFATAVALYQRLATGLGQKVGSSLVQASTVQQGAWLASEIRSDSESDPAHGEFGLSALYRLYRGSDRSFFVAAQLEDLSRLTKVAGVTVSDRVLATWTDPAGSLSTALDARFATSPAETWVRALRDSEIIARVVATIDEAAEYLAARGAVYFEPGMEGPRVPRPGIGNWLSDTPPLVGPNPGPIGSQVLEILEEHGLTFEEIVILNGEGVICLPDELPQVVRVT